MQTFVSNSPQQPASDFASAVNQMMAQQIANQAQFSSISPTSTGSQFATLEATSNGAQFGPPSGTTSQIGLPPPVLGLNQLIGPTADQDPNQYSIASSQEVLSFSQVEPSNTGAAHSNQNFATYSTSAAAQSAIKLQGDHIPPLVIETELYEQGEGSPAAPSGATGNYHGPAGHLTAQQIQQLKDMAKYFVTQNSLNTFGHSFSGR